MARLRIGGLALLALFALASLSAPMVLAEEGVLPAESASGEGGTATFETEKEKIQCTKVTVLEAKFLTEKEKAQHGEADLHFTGCKAEGLVPVNTLGDEQEVMLEKVLFLVCLVEPKTLEFGILFQVLETLHTEVPAVKQLNLSKRALIWNGIKGALRHLSVLLLTKGKAGKQTEALECEINGKKFSHTLEGARDSEAKDKPMSVELHLNLLFKSEVEFMDA